MLALCPSVQATRTLLMLDGQGLALTRAWVLFELWKTLVVHGSTGLQILAYDIDLLGLQVRAVKHAPCCCVVTTTSPP